MRRRVRGECAGARRGRAGAGLGAWAWAWGRAGAGRAEPSLAKPSRAAPRRAEPGAPHRPKIYFKTQLKETGRPDVTLRVTWARPGAQSAGSLGRGGAGENLAGAGGGLRGGPDTAPVPPRRPAAWGAHLRGAKNFAQSRPRGREGTRGGSAGDARGCPGVLRVRGGVHACFQASPRPAALVPRVGQRDGERGSAALRKFGASGGHPEAAASRLPL